MPRNRKQLIDLLIGNLANAIAHAVLEKAADREEIAERYRKEIKASQDAANEYRNKINPGNAPLSAVDGRYIREKLLNRVINELQIRISKGYKNIDLTLAETFVDEELKELKII